MKPVVIRGVLGFVKSAGIVLFGVGAAAAVLAPLFSGSRIAGGLPRPGPAVVWAADRGAGRVYGLDANWLVAETVRVAAPIRVAPASAGGVWIVRAREPNASSPHDLVLWTGDPRTGLELEIGRCVDLCATRRGDALLVELDERRARCASRITRDGGREIVAAGESLTAVAGLSRSIAVGTGDGELLRFRTDGRAMSCAVIARSIVDLAPGPAPDWVWVLDSGQDIVLVDADDRRVFNAPIGFESRALAPVPDDELVWVSERTGPRARRIGRPGTPALECSLLSAGPAECALGLAGGGVLFALPGALICRDGHGRPAPGQGGFHTLVDFAPR